MNTAFPHTLLQYEHPGKGNEIAHFVITTAPISFILVSGVIESTVQLPVGLIAKKEKKKKTKKT